MQKPSALFRFLFWSYLAAIPIVVAALFVLAPPLRLGDGTLAALGRALESVDFRFVAAAVIVFLGLTGLAIAAVWRRAHAAGLETTRLSGVIASLLEGRSIPVRVEVVGLVPLRIEEPLTVPVEVDTTIALDQEIEVEANVPVRTVLPIDVEVETNILRLGTIKIPIRAKVPIDLVVPLKAPVRLRTPGIAIAMKEQARVTLPVIDVPVNASVDARLDLAANFRKLEEHVFPAPR